VQAIILAGGLGTRLRPTVGDVPKSMAAVGGRPFLEHLLHQLQRAGFDSVVICAGYRADQVTAHLNDGTAYRLAIEISTEEQPMGTGGALKLAEPLLRGDRWLLMNGDSYFDIPLDDLVRHHEAAKARATIALVRVDDAARYGAVSLDDGGAVTAFVEKGTTSGAASINAGLYVIEREVLALIPAGTAVSLERDVLPALIGRGLHGVEFEGFFIDIGVPADYDRAQHSAELGGQPPQA